MAESENGHIDDRLGGLFIAEQGGFGMFLLKIERWFGGIKWKPNSCRAIEEKKKYMKNNNNNNSLFPMIIITSPTRWCP